MVVREDAMINLLIDIKDNAKKYDITKKIVEEVDEPTNEKLMTQKNKYPDITFDKIIKKTSFKDGDIKEYHITNKNTPFIIYNIYHLDKFYLKDDDGKDINFSDLESSINYIRDKLNH